MFLVTGIFIGRQTTNSGISIDTQVPYTGETVSTSLSDGKVNINTATVDELMLLPNIGKTLASRIIEYRNTHGPFQVIEELSNVDGIGEKRINDLTPYITVGG